MNMPNLSSIRPTRAGTSWFAPNHLQPDSQRKLSDGSSGFARLQDGQLDRQDYELLKEAFFKEYGSPNLSLERHAELLDQFNHILADSLDGREDGRAIPEVLDAVKRFSQHDTAPRAVSFDVQFTPNGPRVELRIEPQTEPAPAPIAYEEVLERIQQQRMERCGLKNEAQAVGNVCMMDNSQRMQYVLMKAGERLGPDVAEHIASMATKENLVVMGGMVGLWGLSHYAGVGFAFDSIAAGAGALAVGMEAGHVLHDLSEFIRLTNGAQDRTELDQAAHHLSEAMARVGVDAAMVWLTRKGAEHFTPPTMPQPALQLAPAGQVPIAIEATQIGKLLLAEMGILLAKSLNGPVQLGNRTVTQGDVDRLSSRLNAQGIGNNQFGPGHLVQLLQNPNLREAEKLRLFDLVDRFATSLERNTLHLSESLKGLLGKVDAMGRLPANPRPDKINELDAAILELDRVVDVARRSDLAPGTKVYHEPVVGQTMQGLPAITDPLMKPDVYFKTRDGVLHMEEIGLRPKTINGKLQSDQARRYEAWVQQATPSQPRQFSYVVGQSGPRFDELLSRTALDRLERLTGDVNAPLLKIENEWFSFGQLDALAKKCERLWHSSLSHTGQNRSDYFGTLEQARATLRQHGVN